MTAWPTAIGIVVIVVGPALLFSVGDRRESGSRSTFEELIQNIWVFEFLTAFFDHLWGVFPAWDSEQGRRRNGDRCRLEAK
jgi:hypothetical protein